MMKSGKQALSLAAVCAVVAGYVVLSAVSPVSGQRRNVASGAQSGMCPVDTLFSQTVLLPGGADFNGDSSVLEPYSFDNFSGLTEEILHVRWWGIEISTLEITIDCSPIRPVVCSRDGNPFVIQFRLDNGGAPGALFYEEEVSATKTGTGRYLGELSSPPTFDYEIFRYDVKLSTPFGLPSGWIGIRAPEEPSPSCYFVWFPSVEGDGISYSVPEESNLVELHYDRAFCLSLSGEDVEEEIPECPPGALLGQHPELSLDGLDFIPLSDETLGIRAYDNFSGLSAPIVSVLWHGLEVSLSGSAQCAREAATFSIAFFDDDNGVHGAQRAHFDLEAAKAQLGSFYLFPTPPPVPVYRYHVTLPEPVMLEQGWISIQAAGEDTCHFVSLPSFDGDSQCLLEQGSMTQASANDIAFCLLGASVACIQGPIHTADQDENNQISLNELLRIIQLFNSGSFGCQAGTEDGFAPNDPDQDCCPHDSDYHPDGPSWSIELTELLRLIQFFNSGGYNHCPATATEDGYCPGLGK